MNKDALLATAIGFFIGLCITGLLLAGPSVLKMLPKISVSMPSLPQKKEMPTPKPEAKADIKFTVDSPLAESIESQRDLVVSGRSAPGSTVVISGNTDDAVVVANPEGKYAGKILLSEGKNDISVTGYTGTVGSSQNLLIFYTPEVL